MPKIASDWMITEEGWRRSAGAAWPNLSIDFGAVLSLTLPKSVASAPSAGLPADIRQQVGGLEVQDEWVCERVIGTTDFMVDVTSTFLSWHAVFDARIQVMEADPFTGGPLGTYDLTDAVEANMTLMDHKTWVARMDTTWTDIAIHQSPYQGQFQWDIKVKRKISAQEVVGMTLNWSSDTGADNDPPRIRWLNRIRVLGSIYM